MDQKLDAVSDAIEVQLRKTVRPPLEAHKILGSGYHLDQNDVWGLLFRVRDQLDPAYVFSFDRAFVIKALGLNKIGLTQEVYDHTGPGRIRAIRP